MMCVTVSHGFILSATGHGVRNVGEHLQYKRMNQCETVSGYRILATKLNLTSEVHCTTTCYGVQ